MVMLITIYYWYIYIYTFMWYAFVNVMYFKNKNQQKTSYIAHNSGVNQRINPCQQISTLNNDNDKS